MSNFLPTDYEMPKQEKMYCKFVKGDNVFRILGPATLGWVYWSDDGKGGRIPTRLPMGADKPDAPNGAPVKHFWFFPIWDYLEQRVMLLEVTQVTIQKAITQLKNDKDWGDPTGYDIVVKRTGDSMETEYQTISKPHKALTKEIKDEWEAVKAKLNMNAIFTNDDPFKATAKSDLEEFEKIMK